MAVWAIAIVVVNPFGEFLSQDDGWVEDRRPAVDRRLWVQQPRALQVLFYNWLDRRFWAAAAQVSSSWDPAPVGLDAPRDGTLSKCAVPDERGSRIRATRQTP